MKAIISNLWLVPFLVSLCLGDDALCTNENTFAPSTYVRYQRYPLSKEELAELMARGTNCIDTLLNVVETENPDIALWARRDEITAVKFGTPEAATRACILHMLRDKSVAAQTLHRLIDNGIHFTAEQIDRLMKNIDHPDSGVVQGVHDAMVNIFGLWFVEGAQWVNKPEDVRKKYKDAWRKFWSQNRDRYGRNLPLIVNDLCMEAQVVRTNGATCLQVVITNHGTNDWDIMTEVSGVMHMADPGVSTEWHRVYVLEVGRKTFYPILPIPYVLSSSCRSPSPAQIRSMPDRSVHMQRVHIPAGCQHTYLLNLSEAFRNVRLNYKSVILSYRTWETDIKAPFWRGELQSNAVELKYVGPSTYHGLPINIIILLGISFLLTWFIQLAITKRNRKSLPSAGGYDIDDSAKPPR